jgi:hypothetical protein
VNPRLISLCVLAIAGGSAVGWFLRDVRPEPMPVRAEAPVVKPQATSPAMMQAPVQRPKPAPAPAPAPSATKPMARFTNGVEVELLNGVKDPVALPWPSDRPWSPIAEKVHDERGMDWYHHADGSWSTTQMVTDQASGKQIGVGNVFTDGGPPRPVRIGGEPVR